MKKLAIVGIMMLVSMPLFANWPPSVPTRLDLTVRETAGINRLGEVATSGIALPRSLNVTDPSTLVVVNQGGVPVPAEFRVLARWHSALNDGVAPIQWLLVSFPATVLANGSASYRLIWDGSAGSNPAPSLTLTVNQVGDQVTVNTGLATFKVGGNSDLLFDEITMGGNTLSSSGSLEAITSTGTYNHNGLRSVAVRHVGPLRAVVTVKGTYSMPPVGGGELSTLRRYVFHAGSATALVRHVVNWEGDRCGMDVLDCGGSPNGIRLDRIRDALDVNVGANAALSLVGSAVGPLYQAPATGATTASIRQLRRPDRLDPLSFTLDVPGISAGGVRADGAILAISGDDGAVAIALNRMHRYEPQALRLEAGHRLAVDLVDSSSWLGNQQGLFATFAVSAFFTGAARAELEAKVWAPVNAPLRAWPSDQWWAASQAVDEFPVGALPAAYTAYDTLLEGTLQTTLDEVEARGLGGILTFGVYPRIWGNPIYSDEVDCNDFTPEDWDNKYWCGAWTDYHNAITSVPIWAMRSGEVEWLQDLAFPGALRQLHTQIIQCAPSSGNFYCGQAPTGYGGYRGDNNGSHAYFDNLALYYWLTGDETVIDTLTRGGESMRAFMCNTRSPDGSSGLCAPTDPLVDEWASVNGRVATQWFGVFRLLGLASDATFLEDWSSNTARWLTLYYAQPQSGGENFGFMTGSGGGSLDYIDGPGAYWNDQLWMMSLYDMNALHRWEVDSQGIPLGIPALAPSEVIAAYGRTLNLISTLSPWSDGTLSAPWPNEVQFDFSGARIGGVLNSVVEEIDGDGDGNPCEICGDDDGGACFDLCLWNTGKSALSGVLARAADFSGDGGIETLAEDATLFALSAIAGDPQPLNKFMGEYWGRLHPAVARLSLGPSPTLIFSDGFESSDLSAWSDSSP